VDSGRTRRLFFALWPEPSLRAAIAEHVRPVVARVAGQVQRPDQWHVTLEFLGPVSAARVPDVLEAAGAVRGASFELVFDRIEHWLRSGILCFTASTFPPGLGPLVADLRASLATRGFETERRPFRAHLTLARRVPVGEAASECVPLAWPATRFTLVESTAASGGSAYRPLHSWLLCPAAPGEK
jgi:2'-5' RNA ligase